MENQSLATGNKEPLSLTPKNRLFLEYLADGLAVIDAHKKAGYSGNKNAAYELKSQLQQAGALTRVLEAKGYSREGLATEILQLNQLPLMEVYKNGVNINQKIQILKLFLQSLPKQIETNEKKEITAFVITKNVDGAVKVQDNTIVETTAEVKEDSTNV
jgi:hypothetical protein